jgi:hypothetical protein
MGAELPCWPGDYLDFVVTDKRSEWSGPAAEPRWLRLCVEAPGLPRIADTSYPTVLAERNKVCIDFRVGLAFREKLQNLLLPCG